MFYQPYKKNPIKNLKSLSKKKPYKNKRSCRQLHRRTVSGYSIWLR